MENDRKTQIIKTAVKRFAKHGPGKTTLDEIARDLRIGKATIYHYFESKEALFYRAIEWESEQYIEEISLIFDNEVLTLKEKFIAYFRCKEGIKNKYKLLYELFLLLMDDESFQKEREILKTLLGKEELIIEMVLNPFFRKKAEKIIPSLPMMVVYASWGWSFGTKLKQIANSDEQVLQNEMLELLIQNILPD
ncbi:MAG TPA: TetR/AcrR family transcriptional regulator [Ignavibacteriaceae bacterium]|nr:TetR/AcrR family transcriptional regulator [Ignavibacteriaceae bacterium]